MLADGRFFSFMLVVGIVFLGICRQVEQYFFLMLGDGRFFPFMLVVGIVFLGTCRQVAQFFFPGRVFFYAGAC
jgi:hypothetical protein